MGRSGSVGTGCWGGRSGRKGCNFTMFLFSDLYTLYIWSNWRFYCAVSEGERIRVWYRLYERPQACYQDLQRRARCPRLALDTRRAVRARLSWCVLLNLLSYSCFNATFMWYSRFNALPRPPKGKFGANKLRSARGNIYKGGLLTFNGCRSTLGHRHSKAIKTSLQRL